MCLTCAVTNDSTRIISNFPSCPSELAPCITWQHVPYIKCAVNVYSLVQYLFNPPKTTKIEHTTNLEWSCFFLCGWSRSSTHMVFFICSSPWQLPQIITLRPPTTHSLCTPALFVGVNHYAMEACYCEDLVCLPPGLLSHRVVRFLGSLVSTEL